MKSRSKKSEVNELKKIWVDYANKCYDVLLDAFFPPACPVCGNPAPYVKGKRKKICPSCRRKLSYIRQPRCMKCGKSLSETAREYCYDCSRTNHVYTQGAAVYVYTDGIKQSIYRFKYKNRREYAAFYAEEIVKNCGSYLQQWKAQALIPIPLHDSKYKKRGFNQAELIARELSKKTGIPTVTQMLVRSRKTTPMKELNDEERIKNLKNAFHINSNIVKYDKVILIDDIYTTGTTMDACASVLMDYGVEKVYYICLCIGKGF